MVGVGPSCVVATAGHRTGPRLVAVHRLRKLSQTALALSTSQLALSLFDWRNQLRRYGHRFIKTREFTSHAHSLNLRFIRDSELEFYEQHCLMFPSMRLSLPRDYVVATTQRGLSLPIADPQHLRPPETVRRLRADHVDGLHPLEAELGRNPLLSACEHSPFRPWSEDESVEVAMPEGRTLRRSQVERYYEPWQVHVLARLRWNRFYYVHTSFMRHIEPSHPLWQWHRLPENPERIRTLRGMAAGFQAVERFRYSDQAALNEAFEGWPDGEPLSGPAIQDFRVTQARWAKVALDLSEMDDAGLFAFLGELLSLIDEYQIDERQALAEDAEEYLRDALRMAMCAYSVDWRGFLSMVEKRAGAGLSTLLRLIDPVESAADAARRTLTWTIEQPHMAAIAASGADPAEIANQIVEFCLDHDLLEALYSLQRSSFTEADQRADRYPGFMNRRLRPLALAGEQLLRGILESQDDRQLVESSANTKSHKGRTYSGLIRILGEGAAWLPCFQTLAGQGRASDNDGNLDQRAEQLANAAAAGGTAPDLVVANTLAAAVATRNLVSHRHRFLPQRVVNAVAGSCVDAVALVWLLASDQGLT